MAPVCTPANQLSGTVHHITSCGMACYSPLHHPTDPVLTALHSASRLRGSQQTEELLPAARCAATASDDGLAHVRPCVLPADHTESSLGQTNTVQQQLLLLLFKSFYFDQF